ncbi:MAG: Maf family protein [Bacillota bacterium]|nr:Maf family protein [Thermanaerosceptrum fracticalcis]
MDVALASGSPRRAELLRQIGVNFCIVVSQVEEGEAREPFSLWVQELAKAKALAVAAHSRGIVLGADTIVVHKNRVLGKPRNTEEAKAMLAFLSGSVHEVMTGVCVVDNYRNKIYQDYEVTKVHFRKLSAGEINTYVASGEPMDKAGAYGIQGLGALLVAGIEGCYFNVVGLPLVKTMHLLRQCGLDILGEGGYEKNIPDRSCIDQELP